MNRDRKCDENCNECPIVIHSNIGDDFYEIVQSMCPNMTCCYDCRIDDFVHVEGCCDLIDEDEENKKEENEKEEEKTTNMSEEKMIIQGLVPAADWQKICSIQQFCYNFNIKFPNELNWLIERYVPKADDPGTISLLKECTLTAPKSFSIDLDKIPKFIRTLKVTFKEYDANEITTVRSVPNISDRYRDLHKVYINCKKLGIDSPDEAKVCKKRPDDFQYAYGPHITWKYIHKMYTIDRVLTLDLGAFPSSEIKTLVILTQ